ncbi:MAG: DNA repair protein RadA [Planctomycetota bacterium]|nr:MAG: DNA repair protein RadA [Planctomycetota bacterium]
MAKKVARYGCSECGETFARWAGRCPSCGTMNSIQELRGDAAAVADINRQQQQASAALQLEPLHSDDADVVPRLDCGIAELDRVLGGGLPAGASVLVGGEPGVGKSTLLAQAAAGWSRSGPVCYATAEESLTQVRARCRRLRLEASQLQLTATTDAQALAGLLRSGQHRAMVVDSIQTVGLNDADGGVGSVSQVRASAQLLSEAARAGNCGLILVGQVTKDGSLAGPRLLEHLVDAVISFEGDRYQDLRTLRAVKNRYGSTNEIGLFRMGGKGLEEVADPGGWFITNRDDQQSGSCVIPAVEGNRCLMLEVQALVNPTEAPQPVRRVSGCDANRVAMVLAVLTRRLRYPLGGCDVFVNVTGGARILEPAADLGIALALASAWRDIPVPKDLVALGEVGLGGELRPAPRYELRAAEARRLGFKRLLGPGSGQGSGRLVAHRLDDAMEVAFP